MARPVVFTWPAADTDAICLLQTLSAAGNLLINGALATGQPGTTYVVFDGISRTVSLTSTNNLSAVNFTITGTYRGSSISETRAGPNNNTVYTTAIFDSVTSVSASAAAAAVSVGSGTTGQTHWLNADYYQQYPVKTIQTVVTGTINYSFQVTLDDVQTNATPTVNTPITALTTATTSQFATSVLPITYSNIVINSSTNGSLVATILQQGVR